MNHRSIRGIVLVLVLLSLAACGTGNRLDTDIDFNPTDNNNGGGQYLPVINQVDSGIIRLDGGTTEGLFEGTGQLLVDPVSQASIALPSNTFVRCPGDYYDDDLNGVSNFINLKLRPLSAHAAACTEAYFDSGKNNQVDPQDFVKVGGLALEPVGASFEPYITITMPVHAIAEPTDGEEFDLYYFHDESEAGHTASDDVGTDVGWWEFIGSAVVQDPPQAASSISGLRGTSQYSGYTVSFDLYYIAGSAWSVFGQFCIIDSDIVFPHDEGSASDL
ncbi:hypothetical protein JW859_08210 [bacterium]|nr:hypothetical protein [bacterium]